MSSTLVVRQRQYAFVTKISEFKNLITRNVFICTVVVGVDRQSGVAFLAHFDFFWTPNILPALVAEAKEKAGASSNFEVQLVSGSWLFSLIINPWITRIYLRYLIFKNKDLTLKKDYWFAKLKFTRIVKYLSEKQDIEVTAHWHSGGKEDKPLWMTKTIGSA